MLHRSSYARRSNRASRPPDRFERNARQGLFCSPSRFRRNLRSLHVKSLTRLLFIATPACQPLRRDRDVDAYRRRRAKGRIVPAASSQRTTSAEAHQWTSPEAAERGQYQNAPRRVSCRHEELSSPLFARRAWGTRPRFRSAFGGRVGRTGHVRSKPNTGVRFRGRPRHVVRNDRQDRSRR